MIPKDRAMLLPRYFDTKVQQFLGRKGYVRARGEDCGALARRKCLLDSQHIDLVVDIGANTGQFATTIRELGYKGRIHSFEPMRAAWMQLQKRMSVDDLWSGSQVALGDDAGTRTLHISANSISSSLLDMLPRHLANAPLSTYVDDETVRLSRLDDEFPEIQRAATNVWLKLDVQGYEYKVLRGGAETLARSRIVQLEMSLVPLYAEQSTFLKLCNYLDGAGFEPVGFEAGFQVLDSGVLLQVDGLFRNRSFSATHARAMHK
jgi:FkbM family methyltransferase